MKHLTAMKWWMRVMGSLYLLVGLSAFFAQGPAALLLFEGLDPTDHGSSFLALRTTLSIWGAYVAIIGGCVLGFSRDPLRSVGLVWLVIMIETAGVVGDVWLSTLAHANRAVVLPGILLHLVALSLGLYFWFEVRAKRCAGRASAEGCESV